MMDCSFCGKSSKEVAFLIAGPAVYICDECIGLCVDILQEEAARKADKRREFEGWATGEDDLT